VTERAAPTNPMQRFLAADKPTRKQAIDAMCWTCMGGDEGTSPGVRESIRDCSSRYCPLVTLRPYR
jgi:hypothetical protein